METLLSRAEIPIIDLAHMGTAEAPARSGLRRVAAQLDRALSERGLALLVNHGVAEERFRAMYEALDRFCCLRPDRRAAYARTPADNHGYVPPGTERFGREAAQEEVRHAYNVSRLEGPLPEGEVPGFRAAAAALAGDLGRLSALLLRALAEGLALPGDFFLRSHGRLLAPGNASCMRALLYPALAEPPAPGLTRCGEHTDYGTLTLLAQDCEGGLEVQLKNRRWGRVGHLPGALLVNTGELLATWTGGRYPALRHRVVVPEQEAARSRARHSLAFFLHPVDETPVAPLPLGSGGAVGGPALARQMSAPSGRPAHAEPVYTAYQHLQMRLRETYA